MTSRSSRPAFGGYANFREAIAIVVIASAFVGCHRRHRVVHRTTTAPSSKTSIPRANEPFPELDRRYGHAIVEHGVLRLILAKLPQLGCTDRPDGARIELSLPGGPSRDFLGGHELGVSIRFYRDDSVREASLDAEEATLQLARIGHELGARVVGRLEFRERYRRVPGRRLEGTIGFDVPLCPYAEEDAPRDDGALLAAKLAPAKARVITLPDGHRVVQWIELGDVRLEHPGGAREEHVLLGTAQPARVRDVGTPNAIGYDAWVRFDEIGFENGAIVKGAVDARGASSSSSVAGTFEARVER